MSVKINDKNLKYVLILPIAILLVSGCVNLGGGQGVTGSGVVITKFEPSLASLESSDEFTMHLEVQNRGEAKGRAAAKIIGIYGLDWGIGNTEQIVGELLPADADRGTEGQIGTLYWQMRAPDLKRGEKRTYEPIARTFYSYETRVIKPITFVTSDELRRMIQNGGALVADPTTVTAGPLDVTVKTGEFVRTKDNWQDSYFPIEIDIKNTGGGLLAGENYPIGIEVIPPEGTIFKDGDCPRMTQTEFATFDRNLPAGLSRPISPKSIFMWNGQDTKVVCELLVITPPEFQEKRELSVVMKYIYYVDKTVPISVTGTQEWGL